MSADDNTVRVVVVTQDEEVPAIIDIKQGKAPRKDGILVTVLKRTMEINSRLVHMSIYCTRGRTVLKP